MSCDELSLAFVNYQLISWIRFLLEELTFTELPFTTDKLYNLVQKVTTLTPSSAR